VTSDKESAENVVYRAARSGLTRWLQRAKSVVMMPFNQFRAQPDPNGILSVQPAWQAEVDRIVASLTPALKEGWGAAHLPGDYDPQDPFIKANLALTRNLLVRIPDEIHSLVVRQILEGTNAGETTDQIAARVDDVLTYTGSENWDFRARRIAQTECNRHRNSALLAHGLLVERQDHTPMTKTWETQTDGKERVEHKDADHQERPLSQPYDVGGFPMLFPGDPEAPAHLVVQCRCSQTLKKVAS